ncbi:sugar kinase [Tetzosporium hominis]|uniref:Sugar kinase n=1 Tax=Tetzosporium hominis TaxID=2020506 RepID=A0A264W2V3_9BACL|nr:ROK family protein [Tetzosporium hominis]OZS77885.1 sugar kinase [Tetzosporium hominis]
MTQVLGVDIGGTKIRFGVVTTTGEVLADWTIATQIPLYPYLEQHVKHALSDHPGIQAIGIGTRGMVEPGTGKIVFEMQLEGWEGTPVKEWLEGATGLPVAVNNDANVAALAEAILGAGQGERNVVAVTVGTGLGGGLILDGKIMDGKHGGGGEIGHMLLYPHGIPCGCGRRGCAEQYVSGSAIHRLIQEYQVVHEDGSFVTPREVFPLALQGHKQAQQVRSRFVQDLALTISSLQAILDMDVVVVGGGVIDSAEAWWNQLLEELEPLLLKPLNLKRAQFGNEAGMLGAAMLVRDVAAVREKGRMA